MYQLQWDEDNSHKAQLEKDRLLRDILDQVLAEIQMEISHLHLKSSVDLEESSTELEVQDLHSSPMGINALVCGALI